MVRRLAIAMLASLVSSAVAWAPPVAASSHYTASEVTFESEDGTELYGQLFRPAGYEDKDKTPVVVVITPYQSFLNLSTRPTLLYGELDSGMHLFEKGYSILQVSLRGYGHSEGCGDFGGVGEQMDAKAAIEWAASQPWSTGKVGTYGISYDGWTQVMGMANKAKGYAAAVVSSPLISLYRGLFMNRVHYAEGWHATPGLYAAIDVTSAGLPNEESPACYAENQYETANSDPGTPYWKERNLIRRARKSVVPTFWTFGFLDANTKPDNFLDVYSYLRGPKRAWFGQWTHMIPDAPSVGRSQPGEPNPFYEEVVRFFERFLKGKDVAKDPSAEIQEGSSGRWRSEAEWPPRDARYVRLPVKDGSYVDSYTDDDGPASERGTWTFSQRLPYDVHFAGTPRINVRVDSGLAGIHLNARLFDVSGTRAKLIARGATVVGADVSPIDGLAEERVRFDLYPQDYVIAKGHRLGLLISGADNEWFDPGTTNANVSVYGEFALPFLRFARTYDLNATLGAASGSTLTVTQELVEERDVRMPLPPRLR